MKVYRVLRGEYRDSLYLMKLSNDVSGWLGVRQAVIVMGTDSNLRILRQLGLDSQEIQDVTPNDLIIAVELDADMPDFLTRLEERIKQTNRSAAGGLTYPSLDAAFQSHPEISMVSISTPGEYAADQARQVLRAGKHVFCFSHHISREVEIELKDLAIQKHVLMMGPDCGTTILNGIGLGFANQVRKGAIGVIAASGSGLQEVISLIHRAGGGISQAIGVGGRDLTSPIDGRMAVSALKWVASLPETKIVILLAKKISPVAQERILTVAKQTGLPIVVQFQNRGVEQPAGKGEHPIWVANTYEECANLALLLAGYAWPIHPPDQDIPEQIQSGIANLPAERKAIRGLYAGGSLCSEAADILFARGFPLQTNLNGPVDVWQGTHWLIDLGAEEYTEGRAHPFIDHRLRALEIQKAFDDPSVGVLLVDVVLGWGCHDDPAGELVTALIHARKQYGQGPLVIASICGTDEDPQSYTRQREKLMAAGIVVAESNAAAARLARDCACRLNQPQIESAEDDTKRSELLPIGSHAVANVGLSQFEAGLSSGGAQVFSIAWSPAVNRSATVSELLDDLL